MSALDRRHFLAATAAALPAATFAGAAARANEKVVLAVMGVHGRGKELAKVFAGLEDAEIGYLCDPDANVIDAAMAEVRKRQKREPKVEKDVRKILEDKDVNALVVAAPDHWHALATVWACQAGKDVYCEKPISHNLIEGRRMVEAARKYERVVQVGTQRRSAEHIRKAAEFIKEGKLGKVPYARACIAGGRKAIGKKQDGPVPAGVDYDLWQGCAPERPFNENRFHYVWHWNWDYGTGELGNNGIHLLDLARWVLGLDAPTRITAAGGKLFYDDDQQTPDTHLAAFDFPGTTLVWEHRVWSKTGQEGEQSGVTLFGEKGAMTFSDKKGWKVIDGIEASEPATENQIPHMKNFLECVKSRKRPNADVEDGHKSTRLCHLGNIALRTGRALTFDAKTETLVGDAEANKLLGRSYRKPFVLPEKV